MRRPGYRATAALGLLALVAVAGCGVSTTDVGAQCLEEAGQPLGVYTYGIVNDELGFVPGNGGTQAGADALNACIRARTGARTQRMTAQTQHPAGSMSTPAGTTDYRARFEAQTTPRRTHGTGYCPAGAPVLYGGTQYCRR